MSATLQFRETQKMRHTSNQPTRREIHQLASSFAGELILLGDRAYRIARQVWNRAVTKHPRVIAQCRNRDDVRRAIEFARGHDLLIAVRGGGHSFAGHGVCDDGMVIDLSQMKQAWIAPASRSITIEAGILGGELDCMTQAFKMAVPLGSCPSVGVAGYALGGGEGSLTPKFGYACDNLVKAEIVTANGQILSASEDENPDLFRAVRGAGANFGVAASLQFRLHPIEKVLSGHLRYPIRQAAKVLNFIKGYAPKIPDTMFLLISFLPHPGDLMLDIGVVWPDEPTRGARILRPLRTFLKPLEDTIDVRDYLDEQRASADSPHGDYCSCRRSGHLADLTSETIAAIVEHVSNRPSEASGITMIYWHGPWCSRPRDDAFGFRLTGYEYWIHSYWKRASQRRKALTWVRQFAAALAPLSTGRVYVNGLEAEEARVRAAYGEKYELLRSLKGKYDPDNVFRANQNILPASDAADDAA
jgi:FAD/FMN-containing dehydrogenase